ncbi:MAG: hypothetical protein ACYDG3_12070 [Bacillati bacterium]
MKLIGIITIGTYYSPWFPYTVSSIYPICDEIVVANYGYDITDPKIDVLVPLDRVSEDIRHLDINRKILELRTCDPNKLRHKFPIITQQEANEKKTNDWYAVKGMGMTHANEIAVNRGATHILKIDTDQVCYKDILRLRDRLDNSTDEGYIFHQYELAGLIGGTETYYSVPKPREPFDDSVFVYRAYPWQWYGGGGSPALGLMFGDRTKISDYHCAHLRSANPVWASEFDQFNHFFQRAWLRLYVNEFSKFCRELDMKAKNTAQDMMEYHNKELADIKAPEVCYYKDPLEYIKENI